MTRKEKKEEDGERMKEGVN